MAYGLIPEFVGRFPVVVSTTRLDELQLKEVLEQPKNALLKQFRYLLALDKVQLVVTDCAVAEIARVAIARKTGARALRSILENLLLEAMFRSPDADVATVYVDAAAVRGDGQVRLLAEGEHWDDDHAARIAA